ncbi:hypothetical protein HK15_01635 [Acetobacter orientalis]|uniref:Uncharacterized protein n=1 Tax=Acetobacter orientalis TaxID=146474 RepID=A0A252BF55_9PROT|nr:hypothetical protein HK15_01635 [Acetobacter orientalis]
MNKLHAQRPVSCVPYPCTSHSCEKYHADTAIYVPFLSGTSHKQAPYSAIKTGHRLFALAQYARQIRARNDTLNIIFYFNRFLLSYGFGIFAEPQDNTQAARAEKG